MFFPIKQLQLHRLYCLSALYTHSSPCIARMGGCSPRECPMLFIRPLLVLLVPAQGATLPRASDLYPANLFLRILAVSTLSHFLLSSILPLSALLRLSPLFQGDGRARGARVTHVSSLFFSFILFLSCLAVHEMPATTRPLWDGGSTVPARAVMPMANRSILFLPQGGSTGFSHGRGGGAPQSCTHRRTP